MLRITWFVGLASMAIVLPAAAQVPETIQGLAAAGTLRQGQPVIIETAAGQRVKATVLDVTMAAVRVSVDGQVHDLAEPDMRRIWKNTNTRVGVGAAIGAGLGAVLTFSAAGSYGENEGGGPCGACFVPFGAVIIPAAAAGGALIGLATGKPLVFERRAMRRGFTIAPMLTSRRGLMVHFAF